jgi:co-chaperonin GroES (HSP10)
MKILKPMGKRLLIRREKIKQVGLIIVPDKSQQMIPCFAEVVEIGPDVLEPELHGPYIDKHKIAHPATVVQFGRYAAQLIDAKEAVFYGVSLEADEADYMYLNSEDVLGIVSEVVDA